MSFYIQHGYGKGQKIQNLNAGNNLQGIILSPSDEDSDALKQTVVTCDDLRLRVLLDPQTYVYSATPPGAPKKHSSHGLDFGPLHWSQEASAVNRVVQRVEDAHIALGIFDALIAPTVLQPSFSDVWTPLSLQYARAASSLWGSERTIVTVAVNQAALASWTSINDWLDIVTTLDVRGFYLLVQRERTSYPPAPWDPELLANLMRLIFTLGEINGYEVIWGYSDIEGLVGIAAGASGSASGWNYGSRSFSMDKWYPSTGGRAPSPRLGIDGLLSPVRAVGEADALFNSSLQKRLFSPEQLDYFGDNPFVGWSRLNAQEDHLAKLARRANIISSITDVPSRMRFIREKLNVAEGLFQDIASENLVLDPSYVRRVESLSKAVELFLTRENL